MITGCRAGLMAAGLFTLITTCIAAEPSARSSWQADAVLRFDLVADRAPSERNGDTPAIHVTLCPTGYNPETLVSIACDPQGRTVACRTLYARWGDPLTLLISGGGTRTQPGEPDAPIRRSVYLVPRHLTPAQPTAGPDAGIVLESRISREPLRELSVAEFEDVWQTASITNGAALLQTINQTTPVLPDRTAIPREFASYRPRGLRLNRYRGTFRVSTSTGRLATAYARLAEAREQEAVLTRQVDAARFKLREAEYDVGVAQMYPEVVKTSPDVLRRRLVRRSREYDRISGREKGPLTRSIANLSNTIEEITSGTHTFFVGARAGGHLIIDGKQLIAWPADRPLNLYRGHFVNLMETTLDLADGWHAVEFLQYADEAGSTATVAWKRPGDAQSRHVQTADFRPVVQGRITSVARPGHSDSPLLFAWRVVEDLRCPTVGDMVEMQFAVPAPRPEKTYTWTMGDGTRLTGPRVSHVYFLTGTYEVTLQAHVRGVPGEQDAVTQPVHARVVRIKRRLANLGRYEERIVGMDLGQHRIDLLLNAYAFARKAATPREPLHAWRDHLRRALQSRLADLPATHVGVAIRIAGDAASARVDDVDGAARAYRFALERLPPHSTDRSVACLDYVGLLLNLKGEADAALAVLEECDRMAQRSTAGHRRAELLRAEALLAIGKVADATQRLQALTPDPAAATSRQAIRLRAHLRVARNLTSASHPNEAALTAALHELEDRIASTPMLRVSPDVNLVQLDLFLASKQYRHALHLADRVLNLPLDEGFRSQILSRRTAALRHIESVE